MYDVGVIEQEVLDLIIDERDKGKTDKQIRIIIDGAIDNAFDFAEDVV
tara:strand:- start:85 stop:228 length:144 start_codon:yes stop_codon:yes gene_type:complete